MHDVSCVLLSKSFKKDEYGNILINSDGREIVETKELEVPIISTEKVWKDEFYKANQQGLRPSLRIKMSSLNFDNQEELIYMDKHYQIIRVDGSDDDDDEIILVCQRRANNV